MKDPDSFPRVCAGDAVARSVSLETQAEMLARPNVRTRNRSPPLFPRLRTGRSWLKRVAVATVLYVPTRDPMGRFGTTSVTRSVVCALLTQKFALRTVGGIPPSIDYVVVHDGLNEEHARMLEANGVVVRTGRVPPARFYRNPFEAATLLKIDVLKLVEYETVLYVDADMFPSMDVSAHLRIQFDAGMTGFSSPSSPIAGQLMILKPSLSLHRAARSLADTPGSFLIARGWNHSGLVRWPGGDAHCNATYLRKGLTLPNPRRVCELWPFWIHRCRTLGLTNWNFMTAGSDQGLFYWLFNASGRSTSNVYTSRMTFKFRERLSVGPSSFVHAQGNCKPWLFGPSVMSKSDRCRRASSVFFGTYWPRMTDLHDQCPDLHAKAAMWRRLSASSVLDL